MQKRKTVKTAYLMFKLMPSQFSGRSKVNQIIGTSLFRCLRHTSLYASRGLREMELNELKGVNDKGGVGHIYACFAFR